MKHLLFFLVLAIALYSCSKNNAEPIKYELPDCLTYNTQVIEFTNAYSIAGGEMIALTSKLASGNVSMVKMAKTSAQISKITDKLNELKAEQNNIEQDLNTEQKQAFERVMYQLNASIGQLRTNINAIDESEMAAVKAKKSEQQREIDEIEAMREAEIARQKAEGTYNEPKSNTINMPKFMHILFPIIIIAGFIFAGYSAFRKMRNKVSEIGYAVGDAKDALSKMKEKVKEGEVEGKTLSEEEKKGMEFVENFLNKH